MPPTIDYFDFSTLSSEERILLAQELWNSVHQDAQADPITPKLRNELDRRMAELDSGKVQGTSWEQLRPFLLPRR